MALFYVKAHERLYHTYVIEADCPEQAEENFKEIDESSPIRTDCLEYGFDLAELVPEADLDNAMEFLAAERGEG